MALLDAMAEAAIGLYAVTRYVNVAVKTKYVPAPNGIEARMGIIHGTLLYVVKARRNNPGKEKTKNGAGRKE